MLKSQLGRKRSRAQIIADQQEKEEQKAEAEEKDKHIAMLDQRLQAAEAKLEAAA